MNSNRSTRINERNSHMLKLLFAILNYIIFVNISFADHPAPPAVSNGSFSDNKEYIYVIWVNDDDKEALAASSKDVSAIKIHKKDFPKEGLYKYKSKKFLWSIV